jgi:hypothetical protein
MTFPRSWGAFSRLPCGWHPPVLVCGTRGFRRKSGYSNGAQGACVEVAAAAAVLVRDTTDRDGGTLTFTPDAWQKFTASLR